MIVPLHSCITIIGCTAEQFVVCEQLNKISTELNEEKYFLNFSFSVDGKEVPHFLYCRELVRRYSNLRRLQEFQEVE